MTKVASVTWSNRGVVLAHEEELSSDRRFNVYEFNDLWGNQDVISADHIVDITSPVGCLIDHLIIPYPGFYRLHFSLLELQVRHSFIHFYIGKSLTHF